MKKIIIILCLYLIPLKSLSEGLVYNFYWSIIPVSQLSINLGNYFSRDNKKEIINPGFSIETKGPLKIFRNYKSTVYLDLKDSEEWSYNLLGMDRGQPEEKIISYYNSSYPIVRKFIDDKGLSSLDVDINKDVGTVDPFTVMLKIMREIESQGDCNTELSVYDGKRRYLVKVELIKRIPVDSIAKDEYPKPSINCRLNLLGEFVEDFKNNNKWPFNGEERYFDIWFSAEKPFIPVRFSIKTPIGSIIGKLSE